MTVTALYEVPLGVCTQDPDRWTTTPDDEAKTLCRACPRRCQGGVGPGARWRGLRLAWPSRVRQWTQWS